VPIQVGGVGLPVGFSTGFCQVGMTGVVQVGFTGLAGSQDGLAGGCSQLGPPAGFHAG